jgi:hypothetical protein
MEFLDVFRRRVATRQNLARSASALFALVLTLWAPAARAAECLLPPVSVPGLYGAPQWFTSGTLSVRKELDDPRWGGAPITSFANDGVGTTAAYRALVYGNELSVSFQALADNNGTSSGDIIYLGISTNSGGTTGKIVAVTPRDAGSPDPVAMSSGLDYQLYEKNSAAGGWVASSDTTPPSWLTAVHTWRNSPVGAVWAVNLKVDLATLGLAASSGFHMAFAMTVANSGGPVHFHTPDYAAATALVGTTQLPADATTWTDYAPRGTACTTGVSLSPYAIGTTSAAGRSVVDDSVNTFFADVENIPAPITANKILARFSIANWGSTVADPNAGWTEFSTSTAGDGYVPDAANGTWAHPAPAPASSTSARIAFTCALPSGSTYCPKITAMSPNHDQCLLVELKAAPGNPSIKFQNAAARQNMSFAALSTLDRDATISIKGLQKVTGQALDRDLYIYVQTTNMPGAGNTPYFLPAKKMDLARRYAEAPPPLPQQPPRQDNDLSKLRAANDVPKDGSVFLKDERLVPVLSPDQAMMDAWPTYRVHVYYDTGKKQVIGGTPQPVLAPLVPFGLFLSHDGPLYGFTHALRGLGGVTLEEIAPSFYKVHVKNEGSIRVAATITAVERPGAGGCDNANGGCCRPAPVQVNVRGCFCSVPAPPASGGGLLGVLAALPLFAFGLRRRRSSKP